MKHTPGPWKADPIYLGDSAKICAHRLFKPNGGGSFATIENMSVQNVRLPNTETEANARLIAAAPEMLEAIELIHGYAVAAMMSNTLGRATKLEQIRVLSAAIIAKAEGR